MRFRLLPVVIILALTIAACQPQPPTVIIAVVTMTPPDNDEDIAAGAAISAVTPSAPTETPAPSPTPDLYHTPVEGQIQVAEQPFEGGRMFWIQPRQQIWVLIETDDNQGDWKIYDDVFEDGEPESDPDIIPPDEGLYQPERGFGKLWREHDDVREALGWAVTPTEFGYVSRYEYHVEPMITEDGEAVPGPAGYHILFSLYEVAFRFYEANGTWVQERDDI